MSERDDFDAIFEEMMRLAESIVRGQPAMQATRQAAKASSQSVDELIEGKDRLTYILDAPGYEKDDFRVSILDSELEVKGPDFIARKKLPGRVDADSARSAYVNGVLSVTLRRKK